MSYSWDNRKPGCLQKYPTVVVVVAIGFIWLAIMLAVFLIAS